MYRRKAGLFGVAAHLMPNRGCGGITAVLLSNAGIAADYRAAKEGDWTARDLNFHTGKVPTRVHDDRGATHVDEVAP